MHGFEHLRVLSLVSPTVAAQNLLGAATTLVALPDFDTLYHSNVEAVWRFLERLGVPTRHLEDATQDTFLVAHRQLAGFRGEATLRTWLHAIAIKVAKDYRRRERRKGGWEELTVTTPDPRSDRHDSASRREELDLVLGLLEQLEEQQRTVFVLVEFEGFTSPEVAELTQTNVNTVSTRLRAARHRFNELAEAASVRGVA